MNHGRVARHGNPLKCEIFIYKGGEDDGLPWGTSKPIVLGDREAGNVNIFPLDKTRYHDLSAQ